MNGKRCPLMSGHCIKTNCGWYAGDRCAILALTGFTAQDEAPIEYKPIKTCLNCRHIRPGNATYDYLECGLYTVCGDPMMIRTGEEEEMAHDCRRFDTAED